MDVDPDVRDITVRKEPSRSPKGTGGRQNPYPPTRPNSNTNSKTQRPLPQAIGLPKPPAELKTLFVKTVRFLRLGSVPILPKDGSMFWSGNMDEMDNWLFNQPNEGAEWKTISVLDDYPQKFDDFPEKVADTFHDIQYAGFAAASSGSGRVFLPSEGLYEKTKFTECEWPELVAAGSKVVEIRWVQEDDTEQTIWRRGQSAAAFKLNTPIEDLVKEAAIGV